MRRDDGEADGPRYAADHQRDHARGKLRRQSHRRPAHRRDGCRFRGSAGGAQRHLGRDPRGKFVAGAATALEGEGGFYNAFTGNNKGDLSYAFHGPLKTDLGDIVADLGKRWETLDVKFKVYPTPGFNQPVIWLGRELVEKHKLRAGDIEHVTLEMNHLETLYPSPRYPRGIGKDGYPFGRSAYMLATTLVLGDYPVLEDYDPNTTRADREEKERQVVDLVKRIEVIGEVNRDIFSPRITCTLRDGKRVTGEYNGRELMWDFARNAQELKRFVPGLPIGASQYERLVGAISKLDTAASVDDIVRLTIPE
jgi:hypothetical protein